MGVVTAQWDGSYLRLIMCLGELQGSHQQPSCLLELAMTCPEVSLGEAGTKTSRSKSFFMRSKTQEESSLTDGVFPCHLEKILKTTQKASTRFRHRIGCSITTSAWV